MSSHVIKHCTTIICFSSQFTFLCFLLLFIQKSYSKTFGYQQTFPDMSEAEVLSSIVRGHDSMMAVLTSRQRSLQIIYSLWHNKDLKVTIITIIWHTYYY